VSFNLIEKETQMQKRFDGKAVLVTAAAGGIGEAAAIGFAKEGASVMLSDINAEAGEAAAQRLRDEGATAEFIQADGTAEADVERIVNATVEKFGGLHIAANVIGEAIGDAAHGPEFHTQSVAGWDGTMAVCLRTAFLGMKHQIAHMIENGGGSIVNVASMAGMAFVPESGAAYSAAKAGIIHLTRFAAVQYAERGVRVNCVAPGVTPTNAYYKAGPEMAEMIINRMLQEQAIRRPIEASEQAAGMLWLCSDDAAMVTGHTLPIEGGWNAR
jgi:NAD(P)-dependent dehydrogenase (short-subunit alcohol dehydrogenase family)